MVVGSCLRPTERADGRRRRRDRPPSRPTGGGIQELPWTRFIERRFHGSGPPLSPSVFLHRWLQYSPAFARRQAAIHPAWPLLDLAGYSRPRNRFPEIDKPSDPLEFE